MASVLFFTNEMDLVINARLIEMVEIMSDEVYTLCGLNLYTMVNDIARSLFDDVKMIRGLLPLWGASAHDAEKYRELMLTIAVMLRRIRLNDNDGTYWCINEINKIVSRGSYAPNVIDAFGYTQPKLSYNPLYDSNATVMGRVKCNIEFSEV